jgi:hypothetical protein
MLILVRFNDEHLGTMIECADYAEAIQHAKTIMEEEGGSWTEENEQAMYDPGIVLPCGDRLQVGGTE